MKYQHRSSLGAKPHGAPRIGPAHAGRVLLGTLAFGILSATAAGAEVPAPPLGQPRPPDGAPLPPATAPRPSVPGLTGTIVAARPYLIQIYTEDGRYVTLTLRNGTVINPLGTTLARGMHVAARGVRQSDGRTLVSRVDLEPARRPTLPRPDGAARARANGGPGLANVPPGRPGAPAPAGRPGPLAVPAAPPATASGVPAIPAAPAVPAAPPAPPAPGKAAPAVPPVPPAPSAANPNAAAPPVPPVPAPADSAPQK